jgi:glycosyltransferase involved in cell wall biosynthesis
MLGEAAMKFSRIKKGFFWGLVQQRALETVSVLHATSESEFHDIRSAGLKLPVALIPNGVDLPEITAPPEARAKEILYLGRLHPKKGIDVLIRAWEAIAGRRPEWRLRLIGPPEGGYDCELRQLVAKLQVPRVSIEGPAYGSDRLAAYRSASLFALPTLNENFGMVVAEALAAELPVICSRGAPWSDLCVERCGWWVENGVESFSVALEEATGKASNDLADMGARGRAWMARDFGWSGIASDMLAVYRWLADGGPPPKTIRFG